MSKAVYPAATLVIFGLLVVAGAAALSLPSVQAVALPVAAQARIPAGDDWYLAYYIEGLDHSLLYHDVHHDVAAMRAADVLLLGNSRMLYSIDHEELKAFEARTGLSCYVLAFGYREQHRFPQKLIERYDLRPKYAVLNVDPFFGNSLSSMAARTLASSPWDARKSEFETQASFFLHRHIQNWVPHPGIPGAATWAYYRSHQHGSIFASATKGRARSVSEATIDWQLTPAEKITAEEFQGWMKSRGTQILMTTVPPAVPEPMRDLARELDVPAILPDHEDLMTSDGSHLDPASARKFSADFFRKLEPLVKTSAK
ncbi:MAG: hypothetical protein U0872_11360 [Planctomycetaceae bacterium]